jgi:tetratricopeptide (TPR) repeat protein
MAETSKFKGQSEKSKARGTVAQRHQTDFEIDFYTRILERYPEYVDVLRVYGNSLIRRGRVKEGLEIDRKLVILRPKDPVAHYNIACTYCLLQKFDLALTALRKSIQLGYRDFAYLKKDRDLDAIKNDPRYKQLLREYEVR